MPSHEGVDLFAIEASAEVPRRRRIGDAASADRVQVHCIVPQQLQVLEPSAAGEVVVRDVQDVIGLVVRPIHLQHIESLIDGLGEPESLGQQLHRTDAATGDRPRSVGKLVVNV